MNLINTLGTSSTNYLQRNETVIPATFSQHNTTDNVLFNSSGANSYLQFKDTSGPNACLIGMVGRNLEFRSTNDDFIFRAQGGLTEKFRLSQAGNGTFTDNLTVSGVLQSPVISLLGVSSAALESNKMDRGIVGVSISNLNNTIGGLGIISIGTSLSNLESNKMDRNLIGSSCSNYQSKSDLTISYTTLNGNGIGGYNSFDPNVCPLVLSKNNRPFYFNRRTSADDSYNCLDFMSWNQSNAYSHVATFGFNGNCMGLGTTTPAAMFHATGSAVIGTNLTVSGSLQSPLTISLGVSIGNCVKTNGSAVVNQLSVLHSITANTVYLDDYFGIADKSVNQKFTFGGGINYYRSDSHQINNQANNVTYLDLDATRALVPGNLTVSGVLQSPLTSLIGVSIGTALTRGEKVLPNTFVNSSLTTLGTLSNLVAVSGNFTGAGGYNSFNTNLCPMVFGLGNRPFYFNRRTSADSEYNCLDFLSWNTTNPYTPIATFGYAMNRTGLGGVTQPGYTLEVGGDGRFNTDLGVSRNLTVSGVLQSPLTSLIGVSISSLNNSIGGFSSKLAIGKVHSGYANIELRSNQSGAGSLALSPKTDNTENSIYFNPSAVSSSYTPGTTGTWVVGNNVAATSGNAFSVWNPSFQNHHLKLNIDGSSNLVGGLSVGGAVSSTGNATIGGELTSNGGYFNQTNRGLFMGTTFCGY